MLKVILYTILIILFTYLFYLLFDLILYIIYGGAKMENMTSEQKALFDQYHKLAKKADRRMRNLEKLADTTEGFKPAVKWAYKRAARDIESMFGSGKKPRFDRMLPDMNKTQIISAINSVKTFLDSPSSTKRGIINVYKKRVDNINREYGTSFTWSSFAEFALSDSFDVLNNKYGSSTALIRIGDIQRNGKSKDDKMKSDIDKVDNRHIKSTDIDKIIDTLMTENVTLENL